MELMVIEKKRMYFMYARKETKLKERLPSVSNKKGLMLGTKKRRPLCPGDGSHISRRQRDRYLGHDARHFPPSGIGVAHQNWFKQKTSFGCSNK